jgi:hypothetical protein
VVYASTSNTITVRIIENGQFSDANTLTTNIAEWRTSSTIKQITGVSMETEGYFMVYWSEDASGPGMATKAKIFQYIGSNWEGHAPPAQPTNTSFVPTGLHVGLSWTTVLPQLKSSWLPGSIWVEFYNNSEVELSYYLIDFSGRLSLSTHIRHGYKWPQHTMRLQPWVIKVRSSHQILALWMGTASLSVFSTTKICTAKNLSSIILKSDEDSCSSSETNTPADNGFITISGLITSNVSSFIGKIKGVSGSSQITYDLINESTVNLEYYSVTVSGGLVNLHSQAPSTKVHSQNVMKDYPWVIKYGTNYLAIYADPPTNHN